MKDIKDYENLYKIDRDGNVWSLRNNKILKPRIRKNGYCAVSLSKLGKVKDFYIHRLLAQAYLGDIKEKDINHINGNKQDNRLNNIEIVTRQMNLLHNMHYLRNKNAKLNYSQIKKIKNMVAQGIKQKDVAQEFDVSKQIVSQIINGKTYANSSIVNLYKEN